MPRSKLLHPNVTIDSSADQAHKFTAILESITDGFIALAIDWHVTYVNRQAELIIQKTREELLGKSIWDIFSAGPGSAFETNFHEALEHRRSTSFEAYSPPLSKWLDVHAYPSSEGLAIYFTDSTEQKHTQLALHESEERYRGLIQATTQAIWSADETGQSPEALAWWEQLTGQTRDQSWGWGWLEALHPDDREPTQAVWMESLATRTLFTTVYRIRTRSGDYRHFAVRGVPLFKQDGTFREWVGTFTDITERKRAEEERARLLAQEHAARVAAEAAAARLAALQEVTEALTTSLTPSEVAAVAVEQGARVMEAGGGVVALLSAGGSALDIVASVGYPPEVIATWQSIPADAPIPLAEAFRTGMPNWLRSADERNAQYPHLAADPAFSEQGAWANLPLRVNDRVVGCMGLTFADAMAFEPADQSFLITLARQCAEALERSQLYEAALRASAEAQEAVRVRDAFLSVAAHELKTPLTTLYGQAQLVQRRARRDGTMSERDRRAIEIIVEQSSRLRKMIEALLDISRLEVGQLSIEHASIDLDLLTRRVIDELQPTLEQHTLHYEARHTPVLIEGDALRIEQVLQNLLQNAVKYSPNGGAVRVCLEQREGHARISVTDHGIGIPRDALPRLFRRFYRADNVDAQHITGIGVGLYVVKEIVTLHGGTVEIDSVEGQGSTFTVSLPVSRG